MDERHWWIAGKIQESFKIGGYDNPALLEDFMTEQNNLSKINKFLKAGGPCRLFFYCEKAFPFFFWPVYIICTLQHLSCYLLKQNKTEQKKKDQKGVTPRV